MHRCCNSPHITCTSRTEAVASDIDAATAHTDDVTEHIEAATAHIEAESAHTATVTAHTAPGTIKPPFAPTATAYEKMAKPFSCERGFVPSCPHTLLNSRFGNQVNFFGTWVKVSRKPFFLFFLCLCLFLVLVPRLGSLSWLPLIVVGRLQRGVDPQTHIGQSS